MLSVVTYDDNIQAWQPPASGQEEPGAGWGVRPGRAHHLHIFRFITNQAELMMNIHHY